MMCVFGDDQTYSHGVMNKMLYVKILQSMNSINAQPQL